MVPAPISEAGELDVEGMIARMNARARLVRLVNVSNALGTSNQVQNIIASPSHLEAQAISDTLSFDITGNAYWFISEDAPWMTLSQLNGTGNATIQVYCTPNPDASSR